VRECEGRPGGCFNFGAARYAAAGILQSGRMGAEEGGMRGGNGGVNRW
jgi:hypothetical protein